MLLDRPQSYAPTHALARKIQSWSIVFAKFFTCDSACKKFCKPFSRRYNMKTLRQIFIGLVLTLALTTAAFAGQIECPGVTQTSQQTSTSDARATSEQGYGVTDIVAGIIETVLSLV
jgi:hypothetical protein